MVSCGTCYDQLQGYKFEDIFPGCRIVDIHEFLLEKGITLTPDQAGAMSDEELDRECKRRGLTA